MISDWLDEWFSDILSASVAAVNSPSQFSSVLRIGPGYRRPTLGCNKEDSTEGTSKSFPGPG